MKKEMLRRLYLSSVKRICFGGAAQPQGCSVIVAPLNRKPVPESPERDPRKLLPPKKQGTPRHTLVLGIDNTLVCDEISHCYTLLRPHVIPFLREVSELFELVYWTAGDEEHGRAVMEAIEEGGRFLDGKPVAPTAVGLFRHHCLRYNSMKFLGHLNREVHNTVIIDDLRRNFHLTPRQGIRCGCFWYYEKHWRIVIERLGTSGEPRNWSDLFHDKPLPPDIEGDDVLLKLLPVLRAVAASPHAGRELDHWRPDGYEKSDDVTLCLSGTELGQRVTTRRSTPIPPLGEKFLKSFSKIADSLRREIGSLDPATLCIPHVESAIPDAPLDQSPRREDSLPCPTSSGNQEQTNKVNQAEKQM
jgi:hypothetical protein